MIYVEGYSEVEIASCTFKNLAYHNGMAFIMIGFGNFTQQSSATTIFQNNTVSNTTDFGMFLVSV